MFDAVRNNQFDHKRFIYERDISIAFSNMVKTRKTREHSDGVNYKLQKMINLLLLIRDLFVIMCQYICICDISEHVCSEVFEGNLCLSHVVTQTETRSHFLPMIGFI